MRKKKKKAKAKTVARNKYINRWKLNRWKRIRSWVYSRCHYPGSDSYPMYGAKGIQCLLTWFEVARVWFRDAAWMMEDPHLDRIDPEKHYEFSNVRFIEGKENLARRRFNKKTREPGEEG